MHTGSGSGTGTGGATGDERVPGDPSEQETVELPAPPAPPGRPPRDLLDTVAAWEPAVVTTDDGARHSLRLRPVRPETDLPLLTGWLGDPAAAEFWEPPRDPAERLAAQLRGDGRSVPCLGLLDGTPAGYWEIYRADLSALARCFPCLPHDTGMRTLLAPAAAQQPGLGARLLAAAGELILRSRPACGRVLAAPDVRDGAAVAALHRAGFRSVTEVPLPGRRAAVLVRAR
ncbi:GNAT family N-acetyltransferase [Streptomyces sp. YIM 98790]|uniref:GNAT family N-acetyltransferase n=1 Tax=Streptomyces sp. YIM 98790 TaxID=2689077 RepID=UPI00140AF3F3|nr:GNAT family N-acetyltransferase [Streptomyces sp. YIM 98790]